MTASITLACDRNLLSFCVCFNSTDIQRCFMARAESLGQVFLFLISGLYQLLQDVPPEGWKKIFVCYDNICQLNRLKAACELLPLPKPFDEMWLRVSKIIDGLHIQNHKDPRCSKDYHPDNFYSTYPEAERRNTMAAEQTFAWLAKFRKQLNAMNKAKQIFFLYRMILRRNVYLAECVTEKKQPVGGTMRTFTDK
ncbi:uncharacterized protein LOC129598418 [Paramacrobiotus metropolitanus]|uniref:uncharacterized protein LOC129598418 n=1 Tax=Paramacrobiotus metropolitanus TaxID=2943436 RepID=UPI002445CCB3|nr:uncharacterized protein LOC129598418 [Paramacrobiotus metropolitanus]